MEHGIISRWGIVILYVENMGGLRHICWFVSYPIIGTFTRRTYFFDAGRYIISPGLMYENNHHVRLFDVFFFMLLINNNALTLNNINIIIYLTNVSKKYLI